MSEGNAALAAAAAAAAAPPPDWRATLPDELKSEKSFETFRDVSALAKSYLETKKMVGNALKLPGADAKQEDWDNYYSKTGRPESPDKYEFKLPDLPDGAKHDDELIAEFRTMAHKAGLNTRQAQVLFDGYSALQAKRFTDYTKAKEEGMATLKKEWGPDYDKNLGLANRAVSEAGGQALKDELEEFGLGNSPLLVRHFLKLGTKTAESTLILADAQAGETNADSLEVKIQAIVSDPKHPYSNPDASPKARMAAAEEVLKMRERLAALRKGDQ